MWRLVGIQGVYEGRFFDLKMDTITIGKGDGCGIILSDDQSVVENQAELLLCSGSYLFKDIDRSSPKTINGIVPQGMVTLNHRDMIQIGESVFRLEQVEAPTRNAGCAFPRADAGREVQIPAKAMPWRLVVTVVFLIAVLASIVIPNIRRANEYRARRAENLRMVQAAVASLQSIGSALKVGVSHDEYSKKVIDAQTKIDAYIAKFGESEFSDKLLGIQQAYVDAGELWDYKINYDQGDFFSEYGLYGRETEEKATELYRMCRSRYPQTFKKVRDGGAMVDSALHTETAMQLIWDQASEAMSKLKLP